MKHGHLCMYSIMYCVQHSPYFFKERTFSLFQRVTVDPLAAVPSCPTQARLREAAVAPTTTDVSWTDRAEIPARLATALSSLDLAAQTRAAVVPRIDSSTRRPETSSRTILNRPTGAQPTREGRTASQTMQERREPPTEGRHHLRVAGFRAQKRRELKVR